MRLTDSQGDGILNRNLLVTKSLGIFKNTVKTQYEIAPFLLAMHTMILLSWLENQHPDVHSWIFHHNSICFYDLWSSGAWTSSSKSEPWNDDRGFVLHGETINFSIARHSSSCLLLGSQSHSRRLCSLKRAPNSHLSTQYCLRHSSVQPWTNHLVSLMLSFLLSEHNPSGF